jgi:hypothetical protein
VLSQLHLYNNNISLFIHVRSIGGSLSPSFLLQSTHVLLKLNRCEARDLAGTTERERDCV